MSKLLDELKRRFATPAEAVKALGLDAALLAMDGKPLGRDESFEKLEHSLAHKKGVTNAAGLAAYIGREHGKIKGSNDMNPGQFDQLVALLREFFAEEAEEPEHAEKPALAGDSKRGLNMPKTTLSAATARGALMNYLAPRLAQDAKMPALMPIVKGLTKNNFVAKIPEVVSKLRVAAHGRLAADASLDDAAEVLEAIARVTGEGGEESMDDLEPNGAMPMMTGEEDKGEDDDPPMMEEPDDSRHVELLKRVRDFCADKMSPEDCAKLDEMIGEVSAHGNPAGDEDDEEEPDAAIDTPPDFEGKPEVGGGEMVDKKAMDAAIAVAVAKSEANQRAIHTAYEFVRPWVGALPAMDEKVKSPTDVYAAALTARGIDTKGKHPDAYRDILVNLPKAGAKRADVPAMDAATIGDFAKRFPNAARVGRA